MSMDKTNSWLRWVTALCIVLSTSCITTQGFTNEALAIHRPIKVQVNLLPANELRLSFKPAVPNSAWTQLRVEEAREMLSAFPEAPPNKGTRHFQLIKISTNRESVTWKQRLHEEFISRYGAPAVVLPEALETSPVFLALKLSPRYMGDGVREAARELFHSPAFLSSAALSVLLYFSAWLMPEPLFSKAFATALTLRLALLAGVLELNQFARACAKLYQEAQSARTVRELEAIAQRFGTAVGGTGLRILVLAASLGLAKVLPRVPDGSSATFLSGPRYALAEGITMEGAASVQMVADGTIIVAGVAAGTAASTLGSACTDGTKNQDGYQWHHLATNKNEISTHSGGPWTPLFEKLFNKAGMNLDASENLVYLKGHKGPHTSEYHSEIYQRLEAALRKCPSIEKCRSALSRTLKTLAKEICTPGASLHQLATKP